MRALIAISMCVVLTGCQADQAAQREAADQSMDRQCQSFGAKPGSSDYIQCRETLLGQARQADMQRRQMAMSYLAAHPFNSAPTYVQPVTAPIYAPRRPLNCSSIQTGNYTSTNCY